MAHDTNDELPRLCGHRQWWKASRTFIWTCFLVGSTVLGIGHILRLYTHHYHSEKNTAKLLEYFGLALILIGSILASLGISVCFYSCCLVLRHKPNRLDTKNKNIDKPVFETTAFFEKKKPLMPLGTKDRGRQNTPLLQNGKNYNVASSIYGTPMLQKCPHSPRLVLLQDQKIQSLYDLEQQSPNLPKVGGPCAVEILEQVNFTSEEPKGTLKDLAVSRPPILCRSPKMYQQKQPTPIFNMSPRSVCKNYHDKSPITTPVTPSKRYLTNSGRHRQYFHEEHFAFSDFQPKVVNESYISA